MALSAIPVPSSAVFVVGSETIGTRDPDAVTDVAVVATPEVVVVGKVEVATPTV